MVGDFAHFGSGEVVVIDIHIELRTALDSSLAVHGGVVDKSGGFAERYAEAVAVNCDGVGVFGHIQVARGDSCGIVDGSIAKGYHIRVDHYSVGSEEL